MITREFTLNDHTNLARKFVRIASVALEESQYDLAVEYLELALQGAKEAFRIIEEARND